MTTGATIHFTTDGSTPTRASPQYRGTIWLSEATTGTSTTINALATLDGVDSPV
ncbi:chitobiase/beta-hexosaminidase C-terminal domain-containing protein, partial [Salmonella enterica]|uniref:chitobiase/beta-hexosaminidase C-terminal domain-containing protein n=1 Tax=Salmonella enterica TaxID=28901 RepID=UPI003CE67222